MPDKAENLNSEVSMDEISNARYELQSIKEKILACSIEEDQQTVAGQWLKTFEYSENNAGLSMARFVLACIAEGDFKVRPFLSQNLEAPNEVLTIIDYLSHASRIILDYQDLSGAHKEALLSFFPKPMPGNNIYSRSATHAVSREGGTIREHKDIKLGIIGFLPALVREERDFGINIAMGGEGQTNFIGQKITANGYSGHIYLHYQKEDSLLMFGLEQSAPLGFEGWGKLLYGDESQESCQYGMDQFHQTHSPFGASDTFTAAGSLYFSDPVYQAKLMVEKNCFPPDKYGAMQVTINNQNWEQIVSFLENLTHSNEIQDLLLLKPRSARNHKETPTHSIFIDFTIYLDRIYTVFIANTQSIEEDKKSEIQQMHQNLGEYLQKVQKGNTNSYENVQQLIKLLSGFENLPPEYIAALARIDQLFKKQLEIDPKLREKSYKLSLIAKERQLEAETQELLYNARDLQEYFSLLTLGSQDDDQIVQDPHIKEYLSQLDCLVKDLQTQLNAFNDNSEDKITHLEAGCESAKKILRDYPRVFSQKAVEKVKQELDKQRGKNDKLKQKIARQESKYQLSLQEKDLALKAAQETINLLDKGLKEAKETTDMLKKGLEDQLEEATSKRVEAERNLTNHQQKEDRIKLRLQIVSPLFHEIKILRKKEENLTARKHERAAEDLKELYEAVQRSINEYTEDNEPEEEVALNNFKNSVRKQINEIYEKGNLKQHRNLVAQLLAVIVTLGIFPLINAVVNYRKRGSSEFFPPTDTVNKVRKLEETLKLCVK